MTTWINGRLRGSVDPSDRGLQYADGLFETMHVRAGRIRLLELHLERLYEGLQRLNISVPVPQKLRAELKRIASPKRDGVLKLIVTRGQVPKASRPGYRPSGTERSTRIVSWYASPPALRSADHDAPVRIRLCRTPVASSPALAGLKSLGRLESVLARSEWSDPRIWEGLMGDSEGHWVCGTMSNLFLRRASVLTTPAVDRAGVAGVMRRWVLQSAQRLQLRTQERCVGWRDLQSADEVFMTNAVVGIKSVRSIMGGSSSVGLDRFDVAQRLRVMLEAL